MAKRSVGRVENYTNAFILSGFALVFSLLVTSWAVLGYVPTLILAALVYVPLTWVQARR